MALTIDPAVEQRITRVAANGGFGEPSELLAHALDLVEAEQQSGGLLLEHRDEIRRLLGASIAARERGDSYAPEEARAILDARRISRIRSAARTTGSSPRR